MLRLDFCDRLLHGIGQFALEQQVGLDHDPPKIATGDFCQRFGQRRLRHREKSDEDVTCRCGIVSQAGEFVHLSGGRFIPAAAADEN
jgi:hypothetical protein